MSADIESLRALLAAATRKPIPSLPGYSVTPEGDVWSETSNWRGYGPRPLAQVVNQHGYLEVRVVVDGKRKKRRVHRLVAEAFLGPEPGGMQVCHSDGDPTNNHVLNLRYGTAADNARDRDAHGRTARGARNGYSVRFNPDVIARVLTLRASGMSQRSIARTVGIDRNRVAMVINENGSVS